MPLSILLIPFFLFIAAYLLWSAALLYHLFKFGLASMHTGVITLLHGVVSLFILSLSLAAIAAVDWSSTLDLPPLLLPPL